MPRIQNNLTRPSDFENQRKFFFVACEGEKTEYRYFTKIPESELFNNQARIEIRPIKRQSKEGNDPNSILKRLKNERKKSGNRKNDEFWGIIDRDNWQTNQNINFDDLITQFKTEKNFFIAISNPCFEIWYLLHYVDLKDLPEDTLIELFKNNCVSNNKNFIDLFLGEMRSIYRKKEIGYNKYISPKELGDLIYLAIERAKELDESNSEYPKTLGTHVYKLVEKLIKPKIEE